MSRGRLGKHRHLALERGPAPFIVTPQILDLRGKLPQSGEYPRRSIAGIKYLVIHHSAVDVDSSSKEIALYDIGTHGWPGLSYTFVIRWDGMIEQGWDLEVMCYNVASLNDKCLGICLVGDYTTRKPRSVQLASAKALLAWLQIKLPGREVVGHRDVALPEYPTSCPGKLMTFLSSSL